MAHTYVNAQQGSPTRVTDGTDVKLRSTRDGAALGIPWLQALSLEGKVFGVSYGDANCGVVAVGTFGTEAALDLDEFDLHQAIPASVAVIPVYYKVGFSVIGTIAITQVVLAWGNTGAVSGGHSCTPYNMKPASSSLSATTVTGLCNNGGTAMVIDGVIFHEATTALTGSATNPGQLGYDWSAIKAGYLPVIEGLAGTGRQIGGWAASEAGTGFLTYNWAELPISAIE